MNAADLESLNAEQLRGLVLAQQRQAERDREGIRWRDAKIAQITHEMALLKKWKFGRRSEQLDTEQLALLDDEIDTDFEAMDIELGQLRSTPDKQTPKRQPLPEHLPRIEINHDPQQQQCACGYELKRIGEEVSEKLDYLPGTFTVERHVRGKWACKACDTLVVEPMPAQIIDKGMATAGTLAQVAIAKYADHLPLYRQEAIFARAGVPIARSTLAQWVGAVGVALAPLAEALREVMLARAALHADETPISLLRPGKGKVQKAYLWAYAPSQYDDLKAVVYQFAEGRAGEHARTFLGGWRGTLICDDYAGYKALFRAGVKEAGCLAHARRKFTDLTAKGPSPLAEEALEQFATIYREEAKLKSLDHEQRQTARQQTIKELYDALFEWLMEKQKLVPKGTASARAIQYSLKRWEALKHNLDDGSIPVDNNWIENQIRPLAIGRSNWLFMGSVRAGHRAAAIMSLVQSAKMNGHDPYAYLKDVLTRLPTHKAKDIDELLPHNWVPMTG